MMKGLLLLTLSSLLCWVSGKMWVFSNPRCGTTEKACRDTFNQASRKLCLTYNTICYDKDRCHRPALWPTPALALVLLTSLAGLGLCSLH